MWLLLWSSLYIAIEINYPIRFLSFHSIFHNSFPLNCMINWSITSILKKKICGYPCNCSPKSEYMEEIVETILSSHWCSCSRLFNGHPAKWNDALTGQNSIAKWTPFLSFFFSKYFFSSNFLLPLHFVYHFNIFLCYIVEANVKFSFTFLIWVSGVRVLVFSFILLLVFHFFHLFFFFWVK